MILAVIIVYMLCMLGIGLWCSRKITSDEDYLMGGFKFGKLPMTGTYLATFFSALSFLGGVGLIYRTGIGGSWMPMAWALGSAFGPIIAVRFRRVRVLSPSEFFYERFNSRALQVIGALATIIALLFNMVVQITAMGLVWNLATGRSMTEGLIVGVVVTILYTFFGGFYAVVWTDVVQCAVFLIMTAIAVFVVISKVGGIGEIYSQAALIDTAPEVGAVANTQGSMLKLLGSYTAIGLFFQFLIQGPGTGSRPEYLQRMQAAKNMRTTLSTYKYAWVILIFVYIGLNIVGVGGRVLIPTMAEGMSSDWIMPVIFTTYTPPIVAGLFFAGLLAAAMSTMDSSMVMITASATDILKVVRGADKEYDQKKLTLFSRCVIIAVGIIEFFMASNNGAFIMDVAGYSFGILGLTFFVPLLFGLYSKRANAAATWACILGGSATFIIWQLLIKNGTFAAGSFAASLPPLGMAVLVGIILMWLVSHLTKPMDEKFWKPYLER